MRVRPTKFHAPALRDHAVDAIDDALESVTYSNWVMSTYTSAVMIFDFLSRDTIAAQRKAKSALRILGGKLLGHDVRSEESVPWLALLTPRRFEVALRDISEDGISPNTIASYHNVYDNLLTHAVGEAYIRPMIVERLRLVLKEARIYAGPNDPLAAGRMLTEEELQKILSMRVDTAADRAVYALLVLHITTGIRGAEVGGIKTIDWDKTRQRLSVFSSKTRRERKVEVLSELEDALLAHHQDRINDDGVIAAGAPLIMLRDARTNGWKTATYNSIYRAYKQVAERVGVMQFNPHDIRRTVATMLMSNGTDAFMTARLLGHSNPATSLLYDRRSIEDRRQAMRTMIRKPPQLEDKTNGTE